MTSLKLNNGFFFDDDPDKGGDDPPESPKETKPTEQDPKVIAYDRFKEINDKAAKLQSQLDAIEKQRKTDEEKKLADQKQWQELAELKDKELKIKDAELLRLKIAHQKDLPFDLVDRLKGETEEEISADVDRLLEYVKPEDPKGVPPRKKGGHPDVLDIKSMTPEEIRKNADKLLKQGM